MDVNLTFARQGDTPIAMTRKIPGSSRLTLNLETLDPGLLNTPVYRYYRLDVEKNPAARRVLEFLNPQKDPFLVEETIGGETATIDVSVNGIAILDKWRLPIGLDVRVELALPDGEPLRALGRVVRQGAEEHHKGIRLDSLGRQEEDRLMRFIRDREVQALRAARDR